MKTIREFTDYLYSLNRSVKTVEAYVRDIEQFLKFVDAKPIEEVGQLDIINFKNDLLYKKKLSVKSINRKLVALSRYFTFCEKIIIIRTEKVQELNFLDDIFSKDDLHNMMYKMQENNDLRALAILVTLRFTGVRVFEMLQISVHDIHKKTIRIIGKGNKHREIFISDKVREIWQEYGKVRINKSEMLFTGQKGAINRHTVYTIIQKYAELAGVEKSKSHPHSLRHYFCKNLVDHNISLDSVADLAGHVNINTTRIYTRKTRKELLEIIDSL